MAAPGPGGAQEGKDGKPVDDAPKDDEDHGGDDDNDDDGGDEEKKETGMEEEEEADAAEKPGKVGKDEAKRDDDDDDDDDDDKMVAEHEGAADGPEEVAEDGKDNDEGAEEPEGKGSEEENKENDAESQAESDSEGYSSRKRLGPEEAAASPPTASKRRKAAKAEGDEDAMDENDDDDNDDETGEKDENAQTELKQPKRPMGSYFQFMEARRSELNAGAGLPDGCTSVSDVTKLWGAQWRSMSEEEKAPYVDKAAEEKANYQRDLEAFLAAGGVIEQKKAANGADDKVLQLPLSIVSRIVKRDKDVTRISKETSLAIAKATELFLEFAAEQTLRFVEPKRKTISYRHLRKAIVSGAESLEFLAPDFPKAVEVGAQTLKAGSSRVQAPAPEVDRAQPRIGQFFTSKSA